MKFLFEEGKLNRLAERMKRGDAEAAEKIYEAMAHKVFGFCMNRVANPVIAEDLSQDIFLKLIGRIETFDASRGSFSVWFWQLARNIVIDHYRAKKEQPFTDIGDETIERSATYDPRRDLERKWEYEQIKNLMQQFTPEEQDLFEMRFVVELPYNDIARVLGKSEIALRVAASRLKQKIRESL